MLVAYSQPFRVEIVQQDLWFEERLKPVMTGYNRRLCCMEGTRESLLNGITAWATNRLGQNNVPQGNIYWIYGLPGIGKTALAHSICDTLDDRKQLVGAFFCQRDNTNLSEPRNILPTLIYKLAIISPSFRKIVAESLRNHPNLTTESMKESLFLDCIRSLPHHPNEHSLAFVIDALDECDDTQGREDILKSLTDAAALAPWLKIIITSRPEVDIQRFFNALADPSHLSYDLATDPKASDDLRTFAQSQFNSVAKRWHLSTPWPNEADFNRIISRANGLFIFIKTLVLALMKCQDPEESLKEALQDSAGTGLESLYGLYSSILRANSNIGGFWRLIVVITTAQYRPMTNEPIAKLTGVKPNLVEKFADDLSSLLYRDGGNNGPIRVRHLSISDFILSDLCDYQVKLREAHAQQGIACLETMVKQLRFNICKLADSRLANAEVQDLESRIEQNISEPLQYSSLYWSNHVCFSPDSISRDPQVLGKLKEFFEGLYPIFWIEVLSIMGMVSIGAPSLRRVISRVGVSTDNYPNFNMVLIRCRIPIRPSLREFRTFVASSSLSTPRSLTVLHTRIFQRAPSYPHSRIYQPSSAHILLRASKR